MKPFVLSVARKGGVEGGRGGCLFASHVLGGEQYTIRHGLLSDSGGQNASDQQSAQNKADPVAEQGAARLSIE